MISVDTEEVKELVHDLKKISERAYPYAVRQALNESACAGRKFAARIIGDKMIERNKWTRGSVRVDKVRTLRVASQEASFGSIEKYMIDQEYGGVRRARRKHGAPIPTSYSAGQGTASRRTKVPRKPNRLPQIKLMKKSFASLGKNSKQRMVVAMQLAVQAERKFVYLEPGSKSKGIYKIIGGKKEPKRGWPKGARIKMVHSLEFRSVRIPPTKWIGPAFSLAYLRMDERFERALRWQLERYRVGR